MSDLTIKGFTQDQRERERLHGIVHTVRNVQNATDMRTIIGEVIKHCGIQNAEVHAINPPNITIYIGSEHGVIKAGEITAVLNDTTGVAYNFEVKLQDKIENEGILFRTARQQ